MTKSFGSLVFTPIVKALQERYGSRRQYARMEQLRDAPGGLGPDEKEYINERDTFYMASLGETGWPYVQHRGGPKGFLKVIDNNTLAFFKVVAVGGLAASAFGFDLKPAYAQLKELKIARANETRSTCPYCAVGCGVLIYTIVHGCASTAP